MTFRSRLLPALVFFLGGATLQADITLPAQPTAQAEGQAVRVERGGQVAITLRGHYGGNGFIHFAIVKPPQKGRLSELRVGSGKAASLVYSHDGREGSGSDSFTYSVEAGGRVSSPAEVRIAIKEAAPRLRVSERIDFGESLAGETATRPLSIANDGGGVVEGKLTISSPWMSTVSEYRVAARSTEIVTIAFRPNEAKDFVGQITLQEKTGGAFTVSLSGSARAPDRLSPNPVPPTPAEERNVAAAKRPESSQSPSETAAESSPPSRASSVSPGLPAPAATETRPPLAGEPVPFVKVTAQRLKDGRWELRWPKPAETAASYRIEERLLALDAGGELQTSWREISRPKIAPSGDSIRAEVEGMDPRAPHILRVTALQSDETILWQSAPINLAATVSPSRAHTFWLVGLGGALAALLVWRWKAMRA